MAAGKTADALEVVSFSAGACRFAVEAWQVEALSHAAPADALDIEALLGLPAPPRAQHRYLRSAGRELRVSEPLALRSLPAERIFALPDFVARRLQVRGACAVALEADGATLLLDLHSLLARAN